MKTSIPYDALDDCRFPLIPLGTIARYTTGWTPTSNDPVLYGGEHKWATISDLGNRFISNTQKTISDKAVEVQGSPEKSQPGDLLFSFKLSVGLVSIVEEPMFTNEAIATFKQSETLDLRFAYYALPVYLPANARPNIYGAPLLNADLISRAKVPLIDLETQRRIADYLDKEISEMDALIEEFDGLVRTLESRRRVFAANLVQDDQYPLVPLSTVVSMNSGDSISSDAIKESDDFPVYGGNGLRGYTNSFNNETERVLIGRQGALCGNVHRVQPKFFATEHALVVKPKQNVNLVWLEHALREMNLGELSTSVAQPGITATKVLFQRIHLPPPQKQEEIAQRLQEETAKMDALIEESTRLIENLKARKTALITGVVTGRKEV